VSVRVYSRATCDRCGAVAEKPGSAPAPPEGWYDIQFWAAEGGGAHHTDLVVCPTCARQLLSHFPAATPAATVTSETTEVTP
jgi:hypothetical protein